MAILPVRIKKEHPEAQIPQYQTPGAACFDLVAVKEEFIVNDKGSFVVYDTGLSFELMPGYVGLVYPRSSLYNHTSLVLSNSVGVIDADYRGTVKFVFRNVQIAGGRKYNVGDRIGQMMILPIPQVEFIEVKELEETERNDKGFGSTGN